MLPTYISIGAPPALCAASLGSNCPSRPNQLPHLAGNTTPFLVILPDESTRNTPAVPVLDATLEDDDVLMLEELELTLDTLLDLLVVTLEELEALVLTLDEDEVATELEDTAQPFTTP
jgi:hypothetical protein